MNKPSGPSTEAIRLSGTASDHGGVYQAGRDQTVVQLNLHAGADGNGSAHLNLRVTPEAAQQHTQRVIEGLALAVEHFRRRCEELEGDVRRARAEGRREALLEAEQKLRDAEWRVMRAQEKKREAEQERERLESFLARSRYHAATASRRPAQSAPPLDDQRVFENVLTSADDELQAIRAELRTLADSLHGGEERANGGRVVRGESIPASPVSGSTLDAASETSGHQPPAVAGAPQKTIRPKIRLGRFRRYLGRTFFVAAGLPMPAAGMAIRATLSHEPGVAVVWETLFPVWALLIAAMAVSLLLLFARLAYAWGQDEGTHGLSCAFHALLGIVAFTVGVSLTPDALPPLLADCGVLFAEYFGPM